ncbi:MAG: MSHA biogenesis protein MshP [Flavobacteriales bacterium]|jgi:MSHA biogenesis protein MshP
MSLKLNRQAINKSGQKGFLVPLALFLLVGLAALAIAVARINSQAGGSSIREAISTQAFFAAESGAQYTMNQLYFPVNDRAIADARCLSLNGERLNFDTPGLNNCFARFSCSSSINVENTISYYRVQSDGECGGGEYVAQRSVRISAFIEE